MIIRPLVLLAGMTGAVMGQADLAFQDFKTHQQLGPRSTIFEDGQVTIRLQDGEIFIAGCLGQPSAGIIPVNPFCPLGTTGFIAQGDVGGVDAEGNPTPPDGIPDDGSFWSVAQIIPAATVEPFRVDKFTIAAAPPSGLTKLLRANDGDINSVFGVEDASAVVWYDYINFPIQEFKVTLYFMERLYAVRGNQWVTLEGDQVTASLDDPLPDLATLRPNFPFFPTDDPTSPNPLYAADLPTGTDPLTTPMLRENTVVTSGENYDFNVPTRSRLGDELARQYFDVPWGSYLFNTPKLDDPNQVQLFGVTLLVAPDVYPGRGRVPVGWRISNDDDDWNGDRLEVDPRQFYEFIWDGINFQNTVASDELYLGFRADQYALPGGSFATIDEPAPGQVPDPTTFNADVLVFPPYQFDTPVGDRELFKLGVYDNLYELGPFFFQPGESVTAELDWRRNLEGGTATRDVSRRILKWNIDFIDTFWGFAFYSRGPIVEDGFPFGTPSSQRQPELDYDGDGFDNLIEFATVADVADATVMPVITTTTGPGVGECSASTPKRPFVGASLTYVFEVSSDAVVWTPILPGGIWDITETEEELTVVNNTDLPAGSMCLFRLRVIMNR